MVEDDRELCDHIYPKLVQAGYAVDFSHTGQDAQFLGSHQDYDLIILDLGLPDMEGLDLLRTWRKNDLKTPVLILTGRDAWYQKVEGLNAGADDYLAKPFHTEELIARMKVLIRRKSGHASAILKFDQLELNEASQNILFQGQAIQLTAHEFKLLRYLMQHPDQWLAKDRLMEHLYEFNSETSSNTIEVFIARLRQKIGPNYIHTRRGQGYWFGKQP